MDSKQRSECCVTLTGGGGPHPLPLIPLVETGWLGPPGLPAVRIPYL